MTSLEIKRSRNSAVSENSNSLGKIHPLFENWCFCISKAQKNRNDPDENIYHDLWLFAANFFALKYRKMVPLQKSYSDGSKCSNATFVTLSMHVRLFFMASFKTFVLMLLCSHRRTLSRHFWRYCRVTDSLPSLFCYATWSSSWKWRETSRTFFAHWGPFSHGTMMTFCTCSWSDFLARTAARSRAEGGLIKWSSPSW